MAKTVVGLFSTTAEAEHVKSHLTTQAGYEASNIHIVANQDQAVGTGEAYASEGEAPSKPGVGAKISHFFSSLTGGDEDAHEHYATGVNKGGALLAVTVPDGEAEEVAMLLEQHGARNIQGDEEEALAGTGSAAYNGSSELASKSTGQTAIPIIEEALVVGKREVDRGGVRIYSHLVERPVEADVTLRDEYINVERRFVNRPASAADFTAGAGSVIELNATGEEAVVGKTSRVVEEVLVGKQATQHTEAIHDSVRKTEVDVEEVPGETVTSGYAKDRF